jgi:hypothetical protein
MENKFNRAALLDVQTTSFTPVSGAISGVTPKVSAWQKVKGVESIAMNLATTGTVNGLWTIQVSNDEEATKTPIETASFPSQPTYPTGVASSGNPVVPTWGYHFMQITFTPSAGAGNATATLNGRITSRPQDMAQVTLGSLFLYCPAADTLAGQFGIEASNDWGGIGWSTGANKLVIADGQWTDVLPSPVIAALVASTGQKRLVRLGVSTDGADGVIEYGAVRVFMTPTAGFGNPAAFGMFKAA